MPALIELANVGGPVVDKGGRFISLDSSSGCADARADTAKDDFILALDVADLFGSLTTVSSRRAIANTSLRRR